ncbi:hypothetical protein LLEC1_06993 [Akanthomyces lecanii]|uniref:Protein kinase domain-containing protein n=1 Tax=Cordyceps confragosa TaxID=2714763 RepID=A0A179IJ85_CORDF|nr:hypothetical protein LLEC1_06993 [Akanthomyces lecanii]
MHQDIAARNLLVDVEDNLRIFDFNFSGRISEHYNPDRDDMKGVIFTLYEIMTLDEHYRDVPHAEQDADASLRQEWTKHPDVKLDSEVHEFRKVLDAWVEKRRTREFKVAETWLQWPLMPDPPTAPSLTYGPDGAVTGREMRPRVILMRRDLIRLEEPYLEWERPASYRLRDRLEKQGHQKELDVPSTTTMQDIGKPVDAGHGNQ